MDEQQPQRLGDERPAAVAIGLPLAWIATIPLGTAGAGIIAGVYYLTTGYLVATGAIDRAHRPATQPRTAEATP